MGDQVLSLSISVPQASSIEQLAVGAKETVQPRNQVNVEGSVVSINGDVLVGNDARIGSIISGRKVTIGDRSRVTGAVVAKTTATIAPSASVGILTQGVPVPFRAINWSVTRPGGARLNVALEPDQKKHLLPGSYGNLTVKSRSRLFLGSGEYFFDRVHIEPQAILVTETSDGPVEMYVTQGMTFRGAVQGIDGVLPQLFVGYTATETLFVESSLVGAIVAPLAEVKFQAARPAGHTTAVFAKRVTLEPDTLIRSLDFDWGPVVGGKEVADMPPGTPVYDLPRSPTDIRVSYEGTEHDNLTASTTTDSPVSFTLPQEYSVSGGTLANGTVTFSFGTGGALTTCTYKGGSSSAMPATAADLNAGRTAHFQGCSDGLAHDVPRTASTFLLAVAPVLHHPVKVVAPAQVERTCSDQLEILSASDTYTMAHSFDWDAAQKVAAKDQDNNEALYYAWIYIRDQKELLALKQLYIHVLDTPFFAEEWNKFEGKCGTFVNQSDGEGEFVSAIIPGVTYNKLIDATRSEGAMDGGIIFDAVIIRQVPVAARTAQGSIKWAALAAAGFRYLGYEADPFREPDDIQLGSGVSKALFEPIAWVALAVRSAVQAMTDALGALDEALTGSTEVVMHLHAITEDPAFAVPLPGSAQGYDYQIMTRGWGEQAGKPLGARGMDVRIAQWLFGAPIPVTHKGETSRSGRVRIQIADESGTSKAICMELRTSGAQVTTFLMPKLLCDLREWDSAGLDDEEMSIKTYEDGEYQFQVQDTSLMGLYQSDDVYRYAGDVMQEKPKRARIMTGYWAETFSTKTESGADRLLAPCLNLSNSLSDTSVHAGGAAAIAAPLFPALGSLVDLSGSAAAGQPGPPVQGAGLLAGLTVTAAVASGLVQTFMNVIMNTDIVMSGKSKLAQSRGVMSHEYGHYLFCNMLHSINPKAVGHLAWTTIHQGDDLTIPARYLNEAMADYFMSQVAGGLDYGWLVDRSLPSGATAADREMNRDQDGYEPGDYCVDPISPSPTGDDCWEQNRNEVETDPAESGSIGRIATLVMDAFDGHGAPRGSLMPGDGDVWNYSAVGVDAAYGHNEGKLPLVYSSYGYLNRDAHLERVALTPSNGWYIFAREIARDLNNYGGGAEIDDEKIYGALFAAMADQGVSWCDACRVLALHVEDRKGLSVGELLRTCIEDPLLSQVLGANASMASSVNADTCQPCPAGQGTLPDGTCGVCSVDRVVDAASLTIAGQSFDPTVTASGDTCPLTFVLDVQNLAAFPATFTGLGVSVKPQADNPSTCEQNYNMLVEQLDASGAVTSSQDASATGEWLACGVTPEGEICNADKCEELPAVHRTPPLSAATWRIQVPARTGTVVELVVSEEEDDEIIR